MKFKIQNSRSKKARLAQRSWMAKFKILVIVPVFFLFATGVEAQYGFTNYLGNSPGQQFNVQQLFNLLSRLSCWFLRFGIIALGVMMIVYGLMFIKSRGNSSEISNAKKAFGWGIVGGLVIMGVFTIILTIPELLTFGTSEPIDYPILRILNNCS